MRNPLITTLTLLLVAAQNEGPRSEYDYRIHTVLTHLMDIQGWSDVKKADLFAMLAEWCDMDDTMTDLEVKVERALERNRQRYPHG